MSTPTSPEPKRSSSEIRKIHSFSDSESSDVENSRKSETEATISRKSSEERKGDSLGRSKSEKAEDKPGVRKLWKSFRAATSIGGRESKNAATHDEEDEDEDKSRDSITPHEEEEEDKKKSGVFGRVLRR